MKKQKQIDISKIIIPIDAVNKLKEFHSELDEHLNFEEFEELLKVYQKVLNRLEEETNQKIDKIIEFKPLS
ncbi:hypothetical protein PXW92_03690 [Staphylococcus hominis]|uniref:hypothetical protein n=1 Tax=Staphylococcus hominis TaxID=1290 RepID=UPI0012DD8445|nr:hypothetical protein [Staphylococcus hominis]MDS0980491.1 hypothetical protein [Staphylococcus hominis]QGR78534.1 hypothetical protein FOC54_00580 [Staphylococcus hominis]